MKEIKKKIKSYNLPWGKIGFTICYDLRFPILYRKFYFSGKLFLNLSRPADVETSQVNIIKSFTFFAKSKETIPNVALEPIKDQVFILFSSKLINSLIIFKFS